MTVKGTCSVTVITNKEIQAVWRYYLLRGSTMSAPAIDDKTVRPPTTGGTEWTAYEPAFSEGATNSLYFTDCMVFTDGSISYSEVSKSTSYEAAKEAYHKANNAQTSADNTKNQIISMGEQLVINGNGLMGDNTNFSALIFDASKANGSPGSFTREGTTYSVPISVNFIPINPNLRYSFEMDAISKNGLINMDSFLDFYDVDKRQITASYHMYINNTLTYLSQDLKNGDTVVYLNDLSGWNNSTTRSYERGFIFWNYTNSFGYTYPELTYSRNRWENLYENSNVDKTNNTITLSSPWSRGTFEAGTKLSQCSSGGTYKYQGLNNSYPPTEWAHYYGFYDGTDYSGTNINTKFPPGTAYAKVGFLWNFNKVDDQCWVTNISLKTDYDNAINNAQTTANTANTTANAARDKILSWCHENNQTLIDGAKIYTGSIDAESINVESLTADAVFIDEMETNLTRFKAVGENEYYETEITGEGIDFKYGTSEETAKTIAGISGDELQIKKTSVLDEMKIGKWSWKVNPNNNHLTLRWNGGDE